MKIYNKFVESKKEPSNKNDIWFDGSVVKIYKEGSWTTITLTKEATERLIEYANSLYVYVIVEELPTLGEDNKIYILKNDTEDSSVELLEYIWEDNGWKSVGNFNSINVTLDYPFEKGEVDNSAILKGGNNQVISEGGVALGKDNLVGLKGFYYKYITLKAGGNTKLANVYLSKTQVSNPTINTNSGASFKDASIKPQNYWAVGDIISIINDAKYDDIATIKQVKDGLVQIEWLDGKSPFSTVKTESNLSSEDYSIYCLDKPENGIADLGQYSFANGTDNKAINTYTEVSGKGNVAKGKFAKVWGKDNVGGYNTTTFGTKNVNLTDNSLVNGTNNINEGNNSVIHGNQNKNYGKRAFVTGNGNITNNENEVAFGKYNKSTQSSDASQVTHFSIGIGTSDTKRKNAVEVKQNGDVYIIGVGGYDGTNPTESRDLRSVIEPIIIEWDSIKDYANGEGLNNMTELPWLDKTMSGEYKKYNWAIQKDGIIHPCVVIPDLDSNRIQMLFFTRNEIEGTTGPLGNAIMKYSGLRMTTGWDDIYGDEYYKAIYKISNGGSLEVREFVFGENTNKNAYLLAAAQMSKIDTIDCKWVYTDTSGRITNVDAIFTVSNNSLVYIDGKGTLNNILFNNDGSYEKNSLNLLDRIYELEDIISQITERE